MDLFLLCRYPQSHGTNCKREQHQNREDQTAFDRGIINCARIKTSKKQDTLAPIQMKIFGLVCNLVLFENEFCTSEASQVTGPFSWYCISFIVIL